MKKLLAALALSSVCSITSYAAITCGGPRDAYQVDFNHGPRGDFAFVKSHGQLVRFGELSCRDGNENDHGSLLKVCDSREASMGGYTAYLYGSSDRRDQRGLKVELYQKSHRGSHVVASLPCQR